MAARSLSRERGRDRRLQRAEPGMLQLPGVQHQALGFRAAVASITSNRMTDRREMNADLMSSSRLDLDFNSRSFERPHDCDRVAAVDRRVDRRFMFDRTIDHCDVSL